MPERSDLLAAILEAPEGAEILAASPCFSRLSEASVLGS
jgi:hypothetical protein